MQAVQTLAYFIPETPNSFRGTHSSCRRIRRSHFASCSSLCLAAFDCKWLYCLSPFKSTKCCIFSNYLGCAHRDLVFASLLKPALMTSLGTGMKQLSHTRLSSSLLERTHLPRASSLIASLSIRFTLNPMHLKVGIYFALFF